MQNYSPIKTGQCTLKTSGKVSNLSRGHNEKINLPEHRFTLIRFNIAPKLSKTFMLRTHGPQALIISDCNEGLIFSGCNHSLR